MKRPKLLDIYYFLDVCCYLWSVSFIFFISLENDGFCCGLGGVYKLPYPVGTGEAWLIVNDQVIQTMPRFAVRFCRAVINHARGILSLHRIHADVESHMEQNLRWAELCGFEKESVMKNFLGVGKNVTRMVIV